MSANIVSIDRLLRRSRDWSSQELAEFYRVESALVQAGLNIDTERGLSDEGEPWFAFCRRDDGEVIVHIARIGGFYALAGPAYEGIAYGHDIGTLVRDLITRFPLVHVPGNKRGSPSKIFLHPAALLAAVVATAFFKSSEARALTDSDLKATDDKVNDGRAATIRFAASKGAENANAAAMLNAAAHAAIVMAIITALQATSGEHGQDPSQAVTLASDLIDLGALPPTAVHEAARLPPPVVGGGAELGADISVHLPTQVAALGPLPGDTVSVEVSADRSVQSPSGSHVSDSPPAADGAAVTLESSILRADAVPHIQAAKSGSGAKAVIDDHPTGQDNIPKQSNLQPADVSHALQTATHSAVESHTAPSASSPSSSIVAVTTPPAHVTPPAPPVHDGSHPAQALSAPSGTAADGSSHGPIADPSPAALAARASALLNVSAWSQVSGTASDSVTDYSITDYHYWAAPYNKWVTPYSNLAGQQPATPDNKDAEIKLQLVTQASTDSAATKLQLFQDSNGVAAQLQLPTPENMTAQNDTNRAATSPLPITPDSTTAVIYDKFVSMTLDSSNGTTIALVGVPPDASDLLLKAASVI
jgi:hypothetical protein